jgi:hypothetical protein
MRKIIKSILNEMYTEDFWLRRIGDNNEDLIDALKKYKVIFNRIIFNYGRKGKIF